MAQTNLAVDKAVADRLRAKAKNAEVTTFELTNRLLEYALDRAVVTVQVREIELIAAEVSEYEPEPGDSTKRGRGRPPKS